MKIDIRGAYSGHPYIYVTLKTDTVTVELLSAGDAKEAQELASIFSEAARDIYSRFPLPDPKESPDA